MNTSTSTTASPSPPHPQALRWYDVLYGLHDSESPFHDEHDLSPSPQNKETSIPPHPILPYCHSSYIHVVPKSQIHCLNLSIISFPSPKIFLTSQTMSQPAGLIYALIACILDWRTDTDNSRDSYACRDIAISTLRFELHLNARLSVPARRMPADQIEEPS